MTQFIDTLVGIFQSSGFAQFGEPGGYLYAVMICVGCFLLYLAIVKEFEPLILLPMAFGMILANLPGSGIIHMQYFVVSSYKMLKAHPEWKSGIRKLEQSVNGKRYRYVPKGNSCSISSSKAASSS